MMKFQKIILLILIFLYLIWWLFLYFFQRHLIYFPDQADFYSCESFRDAEKVKYGNTRMYLVKKDPTRLVVFYHGNAASACSTAYIRDVIDSSGASVLIPEYIWYSGDQAKPTKEGILFNVEEVIQYIKTQKYSSITVIGESLGTAMSSYHTLLFAPEKLILISPFSRFIDIVKERIWMYPSWITTETYDNVENLKNFRNKVLIIHGDSDDVVPIGLSEKLFSHIPSQNKKRIIISWWEHNYIWSNQDVRELVREFIK